MLLLAFLAGAGAHYAAANFSAYGQVGVGPAPPQPRGKWPALDSADVVGLARAAFYAELGKYGPLEVREFSRGHLGYNVTLQDTQADLDGGAEVRVSKAGSACVVGLYR